MTFGYLAIFNQIKQTFLLHESSLSLSLLTHDAFDDFDYDDDDDDD